ncbi:hypothetical protein KAH55_12255, partial [bacterium]|nr:hypothetical protein [bacterium]
MKIMWVLTFGVIWLIFHTPAIAAGSLTDVSVTPEISNVAGSYTSMNVAFTVTNALPADGRIKVVFGIVGGDSITCYNGSVVVSNDVTTLDGGFTVEWPDAATGSHNSIVIKRDGTGTQTNPGEVVNCSFGNVLLPATPGSYPVTTVETRNTTTIDIASNAATIHVFSSAGIASFDIAVVANQTAGIPFNLTINNAVDSRGLAANGVVRISAAAKAGTSPSGQAPVFRDVTVTNGTGVAEQMLFEANTNVKLQAQVDGGITKTTNSFDVAPSATVATAKIYDGSTGDVPGATETSDFGIESGVTKQVHALGWDLFGNYIGATAVDWAVGGNAVNDTIGTVSPANGLSTTFTAGKVGVCTIQALLSGVVKDESGLVTVSANSATITNINIQDTPYPSGTRMNLAIDMTTDDNLKLYAVGYDGSGNYVGLVNDAMWTSSGDLSPAVSETGASILFEPDSVTTGVNNYIQAGRPDLVDDYTGRITVGVGALHH